MTTATDSAPGGSFGAVPLLTALVGTLILGYGLLLVPVSVFGGVWVAAVGLSLLLSGAFATERVGDRLDLSAADRRSLSLSFAVLAVVLLIAFAAVNGASFESGAVDESG